MKYLVLTYYHKNLKMSITIIFEICYLPYPFSEKMVGYASGPPKIKEVHESVPLLFLYAYYMRGIERSEKFVLLFYPKYVIMNVER